MNDQTITLPFDVDLPPIKTLRAGELTCVYELGNLRTIRIGDTEVVRMIYGAVRDEHWATAPYEIVDETIEATGQTFSIRYADFYKLNDIQYKVHFEIIGAGDNTITFRMQGEALSHFKRNRIGLCVLHPIKECAGVEAEVTKADGTSYNASFPKSISPHQPFLDITQLKYSIAGDEVLLHFEGDVFETEDQRNWTDSSFKTYSTPLALPFPVDVKPGDTIIQAVTLRVRRTGEAITAGTANVGEQREQKTKLPHIGFCRRPGSPLLTEQAIGLLKKLPFHHYRVTLDLSDATWTEEWQRGLIEAQQLGTLLELIVFFSGDTEQETTALTVQLEGSAAQIFSILILQKGQKATPQTLMEKVYPVLKGTFSNAHIGWGTDGNFAELNRHRPGDAPHDFVSFSLHPQVHASDVRSIIENLETQHHTLKTIRTFTQQPVHVSPTTFAGHHRNASDARQQTSFAAWWTLKALQNLSTADCITFYDVTGPNGLLQFDAGSDHIVETPIYKAFEQLQLSAPVYVIQQHGGDWMQEPVVFENSTGERLQFALAGMRF